MPVRQLTLSTTLPFSASRVWERMKTSASMCDVSAPLVTFVPTEPARFPAQWQQGATYRMRMRLFGIVPGGWHEIRVERVDEVKKEIENHDAGPLIRSWKHTLSVVDRGDGQSVYKDSLEVDFGALTPLAVLFLKMYYRHRQKRWKGSPARLEQNVA